MTSTTPLIINSHNANVYLVFESEILDVDVLTYCERLISKDHFGKLLLVRTKTSIDEIFNSQLQVFDVILQKNRFKTYQDIIESIAYMKLN